MPRMILTALLLSLLACACSSPMPDAPTTSFTPTASAPTAIEPTPTPTQVVPEAPAPAQEFTSTLGVSPEFAATLNAEGINGSFNEDGTIKSVTVGWSFDGTTVTPTIVENVKIVAAGINFQTDGQGNILKDPNGNINSQDLHNIGRPDGLATVVDEQGRVLHWNETGKEWVASLPVITDRASGSFYPPGRRDLILETILLNPDLNKVFAKDSDAVKNFAGYSILFEYNEATDSSHAQLQPRNLNQIEIVLGPDGNPLIWKTIKDGIVSKSLSLRLLNPPDPKNVSGKETTILTGDPGVLIGQNENAPHENFGALLENFFLPKAGGWDGVLPIPQLAIENGFIERAGLPPFGSIPNLDSLFSQPGNDPGTLIFFNPNLQQINNLNPTNKGFRVDLSGEGFYFPIDQGLQEMLLPLFLAAKQ